METISLNVLALGLLLDDSSHTADDDAFTVSFGDTVVGFLFRLLFADGSEMVGLTIVGTLGRRGGGGGGGGGGGEGVEMGADTDCCLVVCSGMSGDDDDTSETVLVVSSVSEGDCCSCCCCCCSFFNLSSSTVSIFILDTFSADAVKKRSSIILLKSLTVQSLQSNH